VRGSEGVDWRGERHTCSMHAAQPEAAAGGGGSRLHRQCSAQPAQLSRLT
jgi:hypothetical protein